MAIKLLLDLNYYKTEKCEKNVCEKDFKCLKYHDSIDKRRIMSKHLKYYSKKCRNIKNCKYQGDCKFSHNKYEQFYHPLVYKNYYCENFLTNKKCELGIFCYNAHYEHELNIELIHKYKINLNFILFKFKTVFCPFNRFEVGHNKEKCIYAHNYQDKRRIPLNLMTNKYCEKWPKKKILDKYKCKNTCKDLHGWKENNFCLKNYKSNKCKFSFDQCKLKHICPLYHNTREKLNQNKISNSENGLTIIVPKNINKLKLI